MTTHFPAGFTSARRVQAPVRIEELVYEVGPLDATHLAEAEAYTADPHTMGVTNPTLKHIRQSHHKLAQFLSMGMEQTRAAALSNYSPARVSILLSDPAFQDLVAHYKGIVHDEFADFVSAASVLSMDFLQHLQATLDENPEKITPQLAMEAVKLLADRSGNAPTSKTLNVNVNMGMGDRIKASRERAALAYLNEQAASGEQ